MNELQLKKLFNFVAYIAVIAIAVSLLLDYSGIMSGISGGLKQLAEYLAYIVTIFAAFFYARSKRDIWYTVVYVVAAVVVIALLILA